MDLMTFDPNHHARQKAVADRLVAALLLRAEEQGIHPSLIPQTLSHLTEDDWEALVVKAKGMHPDWKPTSGYTPSPQTRKLAGTIVRFRTQADSAADPFSGLPS